MIDNGTIVVRGSRIACVGTCSHDGRRPRDRCDGQDDHPGLRGHARASLPRMARHAAEARLRAGDLSGLRRDDDARPVDVQPEHVPDGGADRGGRDDRAARLQHGRQHHGGRRGARERDQQRGGRAGDGAQDGGLGRGVDQAVRAAAARSAAVDGGGGAHGRSQRDIRGRPLHGEPRLHHGWPDGLGARVRRGADVLRRREVLRQGRGDVFADARGRGADARQHRLLVQRERCVEGSQSSVAGSRGARSCRRRACAGCVRRPTTTTRSSRRRWRT